MALNNFNWNNIEHSIEEIKLGNYIKGIEKSQWIRFFIKGASNKELAKLGSYKSADSFRKHFYELQETKNALGVSNRKEAIKKYRKLKTIEILKNTLSPSILDFENLYTNIFGFQSRQKYIRKYKKPYDYGNFYFERAMTDYLSTLFDGMSFREILDHYL